jgi:hypothetical protein
MKMKNKLFVFATLAIITIGTACSKYLDDAYKNPNGFVNGPIEQILLAIPPEMAQGIHFDARCVAHYTQNWANQAVLAVPDRMGYSAGSDLYGEIWRMHYWKLGKNMIEIVNSGRAQGKFDYVAASYSLMAWSWLTTADYHGEIILDKAFEDNLTFQFTDQPDVYKFVLALCDSAENYYRLATQPGFNSTLAAGDTYFYKGDINKWRKFTYGLKARTFHRWFNKSDYKADSVIKYVDLSISSVAENANVSFLASPTGVTAEYNFLGQRRANLGSFRPTVFAFNGFNGTYTGGVVDPRLAYIFRSSADGQYRGIVPTIGDAFGTGTTATCNFWGLRGSTTATQDTGARTYFRNSSFMPVLTYSELQFLKSEAAFKKGDKVTALAAYKLGIQASFDDLSTNFTGYTTNAALTAARDAFVNNANVTPANAGALTIAQIMRQKYNALWGHGFVENWVDMRRYNYDSTVYRGFEVPAFLFPDNFNKVVQRVRPRYNSEYLWNRDALNAIGGYNPDYHTKICWISKP